jgi:hypothetical protein
MEKPCQIIRIQETEDRKLKAEYRRQKAEDRIQKTVEKSEL